MMNIISDICDKIDFSSPKKFEFNFSEDDAKIVNQLFFALQSIFPAFKQAWGNDALYEKAKIEWTKAFVQAGINSADAISIGLSKCRLMKTPWIPSPGEFIDMCIPVASLVPPFYAALPKPEADPLIAMEALKGLRSILR
jgi:hypothetical protein